MYRSLLLGAGNRRIIEIGSAPPASEDEEKRAKSPEMNIVLVDCSFEFNLDIPADFVFFDQLL